MLVKSAARRLLELPLAYRVFQTPFAAEKMSPVVRHNDLSQPRRVLELGCGPGTNVRFLGPVDYLGVDLEPSYVDFARSRYSGSFECSDALDFVARDHRQYDFILLNSLLHHVDDEQTAQLLSALGPRLGPGGCLHVIDLVLPDRPGVARTLASLDRGDFPRPLSQWYSLLDRFFDPRVREEYAIRRFGFTLWNLFYFKGEVRP